MKVLYDISVLGLAVYHEASRTGIARMIESLAVELNRLAPGELTLCASASLTQLLQTLTYLKGLDHPEHYRFSRENGSVSGLLIDILSRVYPAPTASSLIRKAVNFPLRLAGSLSASPSAQDLAHADVFHATYYPCPEQIQSAAGIVRFQTIYDLIPILFPHYFRNDPNHFLRKMLNSIKPDHWFLAISESTKADLCNYTGIDPARVFVTHLAASHFFYPCTDPIMLAAVRGKYRIPDGPYILSLSTLEPRKNIDQTIRSYVDLVHQQGIRDLNLVLVGTRGWDLDRIFAAIEHAGRFRDRIIVAGFVQDDDLAAIYSGAMMFVYPSFYEGFGLPPLEAMQCGVPVITSNTSSLPEVVGEAGTMVDPRDQDALTAAMHELYRSKELRIAMAAKAAARARCFSWEACAAATLSAYRTGLAQHRAL